MWALVAAIVVLVLAFALSFFYKNKWFDLKLRLIATKLDQYRHSRNKNYLKGHRLLKQLYSLLNISIAASNAANVYRIVDLLKLTYGSGLQNNNEYQRLGSIIIASMRDKQPDMAGILMGAYKPMLRVSDVKALPEAFDQLTMIAVVAARARHSFILSKVLETVAEASIRPDFATERLAINAFVRAIKIIGILALRRHEYDLFRELIRRLIVWSEDFHQGGLEQELDAVLEVWLHHLAKSNDVAAFDYYSALGFELQRNKVITPITIARLIEEAFNAASTASLNPNNKMPPLILQFLLEIAEKERDIKLWKKAVSAAGQVSALAFSRRNTADAIDIFVPLLEKGRSLFSTEIKFGEYTEDSSRQYLFIVIRECILVSELKARQDMTSSTGEIIAEVFEKWKSIPETVGFQKSIKQFCQLLLLFWQNTRQKQARRGMPDQSGLTEPMLVTEKDRKRLGL